jgi:hypothetical protein
MLKVLGDGTKTIYALAYESNPTGKILSKPVKNPSESTIYNFEGWWRFENKGTYSDYYYEPSNDKVDLSEIGIGTELEDMSFYALYEENIR